MVVDLLVKRVLMQAGVAVLTGVLMSSAAMAEDASDPVGEDGYGEVSVCPGVDMGIDSGLVDGGEEPADDTTEDGSEEITVDVCADCGVGPDVSIDPIEFDYDGEVPAVDTSFESTAIADAPGAAMREGDGGPDLPRKLSPSEMR